MGNKLKTVSDLMLTHNRIPFVNENDNMKKALKTLNSKKLGFLVVINNQGLNTGIFTDGDLKRLNRKFENFQKLLLSLRPRILRNHEFQ